MTATPPLAAPSHPAKYTDSLLPIMAAMLQGRTRILDPFGGTGKVFLLNHWLPNAQIEAVEIEPEWATQHPRTTPGNALQLPWADGTFDAICTSPTYGNRCADALIDGTRRMTYTAMLGRRLHPDNSGAMAWGARYRDFHQRAWTEARRALGDGGVFVLNCKDHIRARQRIHVTDWHIGCLEALGLRVVQHERINTPAMRYGQNAAYRMAYESVILLRA